MVEATRLVTRITAILGATFIFVVVFLVVDFFAMRMVDGLPDAVVVLAIVLSAIIALVPALSSYRSTIRRARNHSGSAR